MNDGAFITVSRFDGTADTNATKLDYRINGEKISFNSFNTAVASSTLDGTGITFGARMDGGLKWSGHLAEVILFDRRLTDTEVEELEEYLKIRWGLTPACSAPTDTTGYVLTSCNASAKDDKRITNSECTLSCATGYKADNFESVTSSCRIKNEALMLHGCYKNDGTFTNSVPNLIAKYNELYVDPSHSVVLDDNGRVASITSKENKDGETVQFTPYNSSVAGAESVTSSNLNGRSALRFDRSGNQLSVENFTEWDNLHEHTAVVVSYTGATNNQPIPFSNSAHGSPMWYSLDAGSIYARSNSVNSAYTSVQSSAGNTGRPIYTLVFQTELLAILLIKISG